MVVPPAYAFGRPRGREQSGGREQRPHVRANDFNSPSTLGALAFRLRRSGGYRPDRPASLTSIPKDRRRLPGYVRLDTRVKLLHVQADWAALKGFARVASTWSAVPSPLRKIGQIPDCGLRTFPGEAVRIAFAAVARV